MESPRESGGKGVFILVGVLLGVYFFIPYVFAAPLMALKKTGAMSEAATHKIADVAFAPINYLDTHCPPYRALLRAEKGAFKIFE